MALPPWHLQRFTSFAHPPDADRQRESTPRGPSFKGVSTERLLSDKMLKERPAIVRGVIPSRANRALLHVDVVAD